MTEATVERAEAVAPREVQQLRTLFRALVRRFSLSERADVQCCGMTVAQAATLEALGQEGAMRLGRLGQLLGIAPSTLTRNLARVEEQGLVRRSSDASDGRAFRIELTDKGRRAATRLEAIEDGFAERVLGRLSPVARARALEGLCDLLEAVRVETESCCSGAFDHLLVEIDINKEAPSADAR
jgi:DNA-binding MarR family transcriptional regulator